MLSRLGTIPCPSFHASGAGRYADGLVGAIGVHDGKQDLALGAADGVSVRRPAWGCDETRQRYHHGAVRDKPESSLHGHVALPRVWRNKKLNSRPSGHR